MEHFCSILKWIQNCFQGKCNIKTTRLQFRCFTWFNYSIPLFSRLCPVTSRPPPPSLSFVPFSQKHADTIKQFYSTLLTRWIPSSWAWWSFQELWYSSPSVRGKTCNSLLEKIKAGVLFQQSKWSWSAVTHFPAPGTVNGLKWIPVFLHPSKLFFLNSFQSADLHSVWFCGCYFRKVSLGGCSPDWCRTRAHSPTHTQMQKRERMHATQPLTTPPPPLSRELSVFILWRTSGFGLLFSLLIQHPAQSAFSPLALIGEKAFL